MKVDNVFVISSNEMMVLVYLRNIFFSFIQDRVTRSRLRVIDA